METCGFLDVFTETDLESNQKRFTHHYCEHFKSSASLQWHCVQLPRRKNVRYLGEHHMILLYSLFFLCPTGNIVGGIYKGRHRDLLCKLVPSLCTCHKQVHDFVCVCTGEGLTTIEHPSQCTHSCTPSLATAPITMTGTCFILGCSLMGIPIRSAPLLIDSTM